MTPPPSRPEARSRLGCQSAHELGAPGVSSMPEQLPVKSRGQTYHIVGEPKPRCATQQNRAVGVRFGSKANQGGQSHATVYVRFAPKADMHELTAIYLQNREKRARPPVNLLPVDSAATPVPTGRHPGARGRDTRLTTGFLRWRPRRSHLLE